MGGIVGQADQYGLPEKEAFVLPPADEFSFYAGITAGTMKRRAAESNSHYLSPWEEGPLTKEMMKGDETLNRGNDRRFPDDSEYSKSNAVYRAPHDRHMDWGHKGPGAGDQRGIRP